MSDRTGEPEQLLESLLADPSSQQPNAGNHNLPQPSEPEDIDSLIDELEDLVGQAKRVPFGRRVMIDEAQALDMVDRLRAAVPHEIRQAHRILDERDRVLDEARAQARRMLQDRGLIAELEVERERLLAQAEREADRIRAEADTYVRGVLADLADRLAKIQASVQNGLETLGGDSQDAPAAGQNAAKG